MAKKFVHLHNHTEYSLLDGAIRIDELINQAVKYSMPAVAITDHGVLYGMYDFYKKANKKNIKPIIGCEVYLSPTNRFDKTIRKRYHLVLLAENNLGYHNLMKIVSASWLEGFYYKPRVDKDLLYEYKDGIIALSGCLQGEISQSILNNEKKEGIKDKIKEYRQIYGQENYFLELQDHNLPQEKRVNTALIEIANEDDIPLVISNDVHYKDKKDAQVHDVLLALQTGKTVNDENRMTFPNDNFYFKSSLEMYKLFPDIREGYENTLKISERIDVSLGADKFYLPDYPDVNQESTVSYLKELCLDGLKEKD